MKGIKNFLIEESSNSEIKKCAKYLAKVFSDEKTNKKSFAIFIDELYHNIDNDNPDEVVWKLLKDNYEYNNWIISREQK